MSFPFGITITVLRQTVDNFGNRTDGASHTIDDCCFAPRGTPTEAVGDQDTVTYSDTVFAPFGSDVLATDRIQLPDGSVWEVDGAPGNWQSPFTGSRAGMQIVLKRTTG